MGVRWSEADTCREFNNKERVLVGRNLSLHAGLSTLDVFILRGIGINPLDDFISRVVNSDKI